MRAKRIAMRQLSGWVQKLTVLMLFLSLVCWAYPRMSEAAPSSSETAKRQYEKGVTLFREGDPDGSIHALKRAIELNPRFADAHHLLGLVYLNGKRNPSLAAESLAQALKLNPRSPQILNDLADVYIVQGKAKEAEQIHKKAIEIAPGGEEAYLDLERR